MNYMQFNKKLSLIILFSFIIKLLVIIIFHEKTLSDEWLIIFNNFQIDKSYSYYIFNSNYIPSSYLPPLYFLILYFSKIVTFGEFNFLYITYFIQLLLSTFSVLLFFHICKSFFKNSYSLLGATIFSIFPLIVFSNALISSVTLQLFLYLAFFKLYIDILNGKKNFLHIFLLILVSGACLLLRGEFLIIFIFSIIYLAIQDKKKIILALILLLFSSLMVAPYVVRNYLNTEKIHIVNVTGYALWKGNNHLAKVEGFHNPLHPDARDSWPNIKEFDNLYSKLDNIKKDKLYEINRDAVFAEEAFNNISSNKKIYFILYIKKIFSYFFIDLESSLKNYYNYLHIYPVLIFSFMSIPGIFIGLKKLKNSQIVYVFLIMGILTSVISVFFVLPRYKISIISFQILASLFLVEYLVNLLTKRNKKL
jgi:4-amino-4-deoxy-L-arabinose transferase-like glycosyltransferase